MTYDVKSLTIDEKLRLLCGKDDWRTESLNGKLSSLFLSDGPNGLRKMGENGTIPATAMPNLSVIANTWNRDLAYLDGKTIADECIEHGADILLAPGVNIKRTPLCGRNFEYFSEDPYLAGTLAKSYIEGVQSKGVGTSLKHFCANNSDFDRHEQTSEVDERALREIYCRPFELAIEAKPWTVMCSYNPVNGVYASENKKLLKNILREDMGFDGLIVSDWDAVHNHPRAVKAGLDLRMPYRENSFPQLKKAYEEGFITEEEIDFCVQNIFNLLEKQEKNAPYRNVTTTKQQRHEIAVEIAKEGICLLKNDGVLPITNGSVTVAGDFAGKAMYGGGGSAFVTTEFEGKHLGEYMETSNPDLSVTCLKQSDFVTLNRTMNVNLKKLCITASQTDYTVLCVGTDNGEESECYDRTSIKLSPVIENTILRVAEQSENVIVCVYAGSAVDMTAWIDKVKAVIYVGFAGEGANEALAAILTGKVSPCGKTNETFPLSLEDTYVGLTTKNGFCDTYSEGVFVGYRYYDRMQKEVLFPFGHGLTYTEFKYSDLEIEQTGECEFKVRYNITNVGNVPAKEISQVYISNPFAMVSRPPKELKGYDKTLILPNETKQITVNLNFRSFAYYNTALDCWHAEDGNFIISVGSSSRDIKLRKKVHVTFNPLTQQSQN